MTCKDCKDRDTCKTLCKDVKKQLTKEGIFSADYMKPRMTGGALYREVNSVDIEDVAAKRAFKLKYGTHKKRHNIE